MTANYKMDYRDYFKHGVKEGKSGDSFFDAVNEEVFKRGKMVDAVYDLVTDKDYQAVEGQVVNDFDEFLGEGFKHTDYPSSQIQDVNKILKEHRTEVIEDLLAKEEWRHVREAKDMFMLGYETQRQYRQY
jgi:maltodextrin utilization protein YvdJ